MHSTAFKLLMVSALLLSGNAWANIEFNQNTTVAKLPRGDTSYIELTVSLSDFPDENFGGSPSYDGLVRLMVENLDICILENPGESDEDQLCENMITYSGKGSLDPTDPSKLSKTYVMTFIDSVYQRDDNEDDTSDITFALKIGIDKSELAEGESRSFSLSTKFKLELNYSDVDDLEVQATQSTPVNQNPADLTSRSTNRGVLMFWSEASSVTFQDGTTGNPTGVRGILIPVSEGDLDLNITTSFTAVTSGDTTTYTEEELNNCTLSVNLATDDTETDSCSFSCGELGYINASRITSETYPEFKVKTTSDSEVLSFSGSDLVDPEATDQAYAMIAQYLPDGLLQANAEGRFEASCVIAYPTLSFTYAQLSGAGDPKQQNPTCFIATAAYGHPMHQNLNDLRWFRDNILESIAIGRTLVSLYYEYSPALASRIAINDDYKTFTRAALWAPVKYISALRHSPGATLMATLSLMIAPFALGAFRRRAKQT